MSRNPEPDGRIHRELDAHGDIVFQAALDADASQLAGIDGG